MWTNATSYDYITVPERIAEFYRRYPEGSLQPQNSVRPV